MKRLAYKIGAFALALATPAFVLAQGFSSIQNSVSSITSLVNSLIPLIIGIGVLVFLWGLVGYVTAGGDEEKKKGARDTMIYGVIVLFVMVSVWGLVNILVNTFGTGGNNRPQTLPQVPTY